jgi:hypothetical protein
MENLRQNSHGWRLHTTGTDAGYIKIQARVADNLRDT